MPIKSDLLIFSVIWTLIYLIGCEPLMYRDLKIISIISWNKNA